MVRISALVLLVVLALAAPWPAQAARQAPRGHGPLCVPVAAQGTGQDLGGGHTQGTLTVAGVKVATSDATFTITGEGTVAPFTGPIVLTPVVGAGGVTVQVAGTFDTASGAFHATSTSLRGTGVLSGVTGRLTFDGLESLTSGAFTETVTGRLCA